jgi:hypothetical protein
MSWSSDHYLNDADASSTIMHERDRRTIDGASMLDRSDGVIRHLVAELGPENDAMHTDRSLGAARFVSRGIRRLGG